MIRFKAASIRYFRGISSVSNGRFMYQSDIQAQQRERERMRRTDSRGGLPPHPSVLVSEYVCSSWKLIQMHWKHFTLGALLFIA